MYKYKALKFVEQHTVIKRFLLITLWILFVFILLLLLPWRQNITGIGTIISLDPFERDYKVPAPVGGFVSDIYVVENQFVKKGEKLFKMKDLDSHYKDRLEAIKKRGMENYKNELEKVGRIRENLKKQKDILRITVDIFNKKIQQIINIIEALKDQEIALVNKLKIEKIHYGRSKSLYKDGIESKRDLELTENIYLDTTAQVHQIHMKIDNRYEDLNITHEEKTRFVEEANMQINQLKNDIVTGENLANSLKQGVKRDSINLSRYLSRIIVSRGDGYVLRIYQNNRNRLIKAGEDILFFAPVVTKRAIRLKLSDFNMPLIKVGLHVRIIFFGWPALQIAGWPKISHGTFGGTIFAIENISHEKGAYFAIVTEDEDDEPWPSHDLLKPGTRANLWVTISVVPLWFEAWRLMMAQPPVMIEYKE